MVATYVPTENWNDDQKWTDAIMQAFSDTLTTYLNSTLGPAVPTQYTSIGAISATTTTTRDSLKITGKSGTALSTTSQDIALPSDTVPGQEETFTLSADITLKVSGAHWGLGTNGNITAAILRWGFINDGGVTPALYVSYIGNRTSIDSTKVTNTPSNVTLPEHILVNRALAAGTWPCKEFGYFYADFNDTGDIWTLSGSAGGIVLGSADGRWQPWNTTYTGFSANQTTSTLRFSQVGQNILVVCVPSSSGTSNSVNKTMTFPIKALQAQGFPTGTVKDNSAFTTTPGLVTTAASSITATIYKDTSTTTNWTNSGTCQWAFTGSYEAFYG